jgi:hypothetical protein
MVSSSPKLKTTTTTPRNRSKKTRNLFIEVSPEHCNKTFKIYCGIKCGFIYPDTNMINPEVQKWGK